MTVSMAEIQRAARFLESAGLVVFPTETVYGLGADAENPEAVGRIYLVKGRPANHPVIVHLAPGADLDYWADSISSEAQDLIGRFWPGPLTLILKRAANIADAVSGGQNSIGLRCPSHPVAIALLKEFKCGKGGIAAPSANKFGHVSATTAQHVRDEFSDEIVKAGLIRSVLDGGQSEVGIESTILDLSRMATHGPILLRPGKISAAEIAQVISAWPGLPDVAAPRAPGTLLAHYAPHTPLALVEAERLPAILLQLARAGLCPALLYQSARQPTVAGMQIALPETMYGYAHSLYAAMRSADSAGADVILIEAPPQTDEWQGVNDRLRRAAHDFAGILEQFEK